MRLALCGFAACFLGALAGVPAMAADCQKIMEGKGVLTGTVLNGSAETIRELQQLRVERGAHTLIVMTNTVKFTTTKLELEGVQTLTGEFGTPVKHFIYKQTEANGDIQSLLPDAYASYVQTAFTDGQPAIVERVTQLVSAGHAVTISGCAIPTMHLRRDFVREGSDIRRSIEFDFAPAPGIPLFSATTVLIGGKVVVSLFEVKELEAE